MRSFLKKSASFFLISLTRWYLRKPRIYTFLSTTVTVLPGVFHPGLFHSTKFLLKFLIRQSLEGRKVLELGCGTGLISIVAAKAGAIVTAIDLSSTAVENIKLNAKFNSVNISIIRSDLFDNIPLQKFDWIVINPPYYAHAVTNEEQLAWHAGVNLEYFDNLFVSLPVYIGNETRVIMVLTKETDLESILTKAGNHGFRFVQLLEEWRLFDGKEFLFECQSIPLSQLQS